MASADAPLWRTPRYGPAPPARDDGSSSAQANEMLPATPTRRKLVPPPPFSGRADAAVRASGQLADEASIT